MSIERLVEASRALERGDLAGAERICRAVIAVDPRSTIALVGLARVALARGGEADLAEAERIARSVLALDAESPAARRLLDEWRARTSPEASGVTPETGEASDDGDDEYPWPDLDEQLARYRPPGGPGLVERLVRRRKG